MQIKLENQMASFEKEFVSKGTLILLVNVNLFRRQREKLPSNVQMN